MEVKLNGLERDWNAKFDEWEAHIRDRDSNPSFIEAQRRQLLLGQAKEIRFRQDEVNQQEANFYRKNYEPEVVALRAELVPLAPGARDSGIDYDDGGLLNNS